MLKVQKRVFLWLLFTLFFGFFQLLIDLVYRYIQHKELDVKGFIVSGSILFFSSGLLASSAFDVWSTKEMKSEPLTLGFLVIHIIAPFFFLIMISISYTAFSTGINIDSDSEVIIRYKQIQLISLISTLAYAIAAKHYLVKIAIQESLKKI